MALLSLERVTKYFPRLEGAPAAGRQATFCVFRDIDLRINEGEFVTMLGHSGCGKSTLLNIMAGFEQASSGGVILDGKEVTEPGRDRMVVFQNFALMPWLSAFDNVRLAVRATHPTWAKTRVAECTRQVFTLQEVVEALPSQPRLARGYRHRPTASRASWPRGATRRGRRGGRQR